MQLFGIGLAGCGRMGLPMLRAMEAAGFDARGFDIKPQGSNITDDFSPFSKGLNILFTVVRDIAQTDEVLFTSQQAVDNAPHLHTIIICSTLSPRYVHALRSRIPKHINLIDAPMSGAVIAAKERRLSFMQGGDAATLDALHPLFAAMGSSFHRMGEFGAGASAKVLNNLLAASNTVMTRLVLDWAGDSNLNQDKLLQMIDKSSGQNWFASNFEQIEFARHGYSSDNTIGILKKDVQSALDAAPSDANTRLPDLLVELIANLTPKV
ncbi:MAG: NAD(P)-dependent oxidoreductase [Alphaproteobacteria bacterium]|nr:NAD(P)-dependent oxidoreductase [Alphaproteobacteria bacterium]